MSNWLFLNGTEMESSKFDLNQTRTQITLTFKRGSKDHDWVKRVDRNREDVNGHASYQGRRYKLNDGVIENVGDTRTGQDTKDVVIEFTSIEDN